MSLNTLNPPRCAVCGCTAESHSEWRAFWIDIADGLRISRRVGEWDNWLRDLQDSHAVLACGQHDALILTERFLERGTFAPVEFAALPVPQPTEAHVTH